MATTNEDQRDIEPGEPLPRDVRESGHPGGGQGRKDEVGRSGVQPASIPHAPRADAVIRSMAEWGQGERGAAGYLDHGESELRQVPPGVEALSPPVTPGEESTVEPEPVDRGEHKQQPAGALPSGLIRDWRHPPD